MVTQIVTRGRALVALGVVLVLAAVAVFAVHTRDDLRAARDGLDQTQQHLTELDAVEHDAVGTRSDALAALARARAILLVDTNARDQLTEGDRVQLRVLSTALHTLAQHQSELVSGEARAKLLDDCLTGASQVLNEAAVGDVSLLASTLPPVQRLCSQAAA
jgi:hypothetical protein